MSPDIEVQVGLYNEYKLVVHKADADGQPIPGTARDATGWFHNLITNTGMAAFAVEPGGGSTEPWASWALGCRTSADNTAPDITDTNVTSILGNTSLLVSATSSNQLVTPPYYAEAERTYRFDVGTTTGNVAKIALVNATNTGSGTNGTHNNGSLCSAIALVVDGSGNPTTVTVLSDEILDVQVRQRLYIPASDVTGNITPDGGIAPNTNYTIRPYRIDRATGLAPNVCGWGMPWGGGIDATGWCFSPSGGGATLVKAYVGATSAIGTTTGEPAGTELDFAGAPDVTWTRTAGSNYFDFTAEFPLGSGTAGMNNTGGIGAFVFWIISAAFQIGFATRPVKTSDMKFSITFRISWARYTP